VWFLTACREAILGVVSLLRNALKLYYDETSNPRKACAVAKYLKVDLDYVRVNLRAGEQRQPVYRAINPIGKVPTLVDGADTIRDSSAIMMHLAQVAGSDLWPGAAQEQVAVVQWLCWDAAHFTRYTGALYFENYIKPAFRIGDPDPKVNEEMVKAVSSFAKVLDDHLKGRQFIAVDRLSLADFSIAGQISLPGESGMATYMPADRYPEIERWCRTMSDIPAWNAPWPEAARSRSISE
jgi:glutathione S-transferase